MLRKFQSSYYILVHSRERERLVYLFSVNNSSLHVGEPGQLIYLKTENKEKVKI